jgi:hypothetical protein
MCIVHLISYCIKTHKTIGSYTVVAAPRCTSTLVAFTVSLLYLSYVHIHCRVAVSNISITQKEGGVANKLCEARHCCLLLRLSAAH